MMKNFRLISFTVFLFFTSICSFAQDTAQVFRWNVSSKKIADHTYQLMFSTQGNASWNLYAPDQDLSGVQSASLTLNDSAFHLVDKFKQTGTIKEEPSKIFTDINEKIYSGATTWSQQIKIDGTIPQSVQGS